MQQGLDGQIFSWAPPDTDDIVVEVACDPGQHPLPAHFGPRSAPPRRGLPGRFRSRRQGRPG